MSENTKILLPPWLAYPEIDRHSIGWRMGYGEDYIGKWHRWYQKLSAKKRDEYQLLFPEPPTWKGFWTGTDECTYYKHDKFSIVFWQKDGKPKYALEQLQKDYRAGKKLKYCMFWKTQPASQQTLGRGCLSQWYRSHFFSVADHYCCMEQFMMSQKAKLFGDDEILQQILSSKDPKKIKALGQKVRNFDETIWGEAKYAIVLNGNYKKFSQDPKLKNFLLQTGDKILTESSPYDGVWGIKMSESDENVQDPLRWRGQNLLGFALMEVRDALREVCKNESLPVEAE